MCTHPTPIHLHLCTLVRTSISQKEKASTVALAVPSPSTEFSPKKSFSSSVTSNCRAFAAPSKSFHLPPCSGLGQHDVRRPD